MQRCEEPHIDRGDQEDVDVVDGKESGFHGMVVSERGGGWSWDEWIVGEEYEGYGLGGGNHSSLCPRSITLSNPSGALSGGVS